MSISAKAKTWAKRFLADYSAASDLRWRRIPAFSRTATISRRPTVYYLCPTPTQAFGGVRNIYRHVDVLNELGISAAVVHDEAGYRNTVFSNQTVVVGSDDVRLGPRDLLVVPECYGPGLVDAPKEPRVVVFNQGAYITFDHIDFDTTQPGAPYAQVENLVALLAVSRDSASLLRYSFPNLPVSVARVVIDPVVFHPSSDSSSRRPSAAGLVHDASQTR